MSDLSNSELTAHLHGDERVEVIGKTRKYVILRNPPVDPSSDDGAEAYGVYLTDGRFMDIASSSRDDAISMAEVHYETGSYEIRPLFAAHSACVGIKPLVWQMENVDGTVWTGVAPVSGQYLVKHGDKGWEASHGMIRIGWFDTRDEAKAAGQADFAQRIRSALEQSP